MYAHTNTLTHSLTHSQWNTDPSVRACLPVGHPNNAVSATDVARCLVAVGT